MKDGVKFLLIPICLVLLCISVYLLVLIKQHLGASEEALESLKTKADEMAAENDQASEEEGEDGVRNLTIRINRLEQDLEELYSELTERNLKLREYVNRNLDRIDRELMELKGPAFRSVEDLKRDLDAHGVAMNEEEGTVEVKGVVCQKDVLVEFFAVTGRGKTHESVLLLDCLPSSLNAALLALGLKEGKGAWLEELPDGKTKEHPPEGDRVYVQVVWEEDGKRVAHWAEDLVIDRSTGRTLPQEGWIYIGSRMERDQRTGNRFFVADLTGNVISTWFAFSESTILTLGSAAGASDDHLFANKAVLPEVGTKVQLLFSTKKK